LAGLFEGNIKDVWKILGSYFAACLLFPVVAGHLFPKKISDKNFVISAILAAITVTAWHLLPLSASLSLVEPLYAGLVVSALGLFLSSKLLRSA
jgi:SSS family solute:Na+ symporter